jgi:hypothetical protein
MALLRFLIKVLMVAQIVQAPLTMVLAVVVELVLRVALVLVLLVVQVETDKLQRLLVPP